MEDIKESKINICSNTNHLNSIKLNKETEFIKNKASFIYK